MKKHNKILIPIILFMALLYQCEKDPMLINTPHEVGVVDSIPPIVDSLVVDTLIVYNEEIFVDMVDVMGLWQLIYYHAINGPYWDSVPDNITHLNLTPNTCYMNTTTGGNILVVDSDWVFEIKSFGGGFMHLSRETDDGWTELYIFEKIE